MAETDRFRSYARNLRKERASKTVGELSDRLEQAFLRCMPGVPDTLVYDLLYHFTGRFTAPPADTESVLESADRLMRVVELFDMDLDDREEPFSADDWRFIREAVSEAAVVMDERVLTYVMQEIVSRGFMDQE